MTTPEERATRRLAGGLSPRKVAVFNLRGARGLELDVGEGVVLLTLHDDADETKIVAPLTASDCHNLREALAGAEGRIAFYRTGGEPDD